MLSEFSSLSSAVLRSKSEVTAAIQKITILGLPLHKDASKNWDSWRAFSFIREFGGTESRVADMGCAHYGQLLYWLRSSGYKELFGCDKCFRGAFERGGVTFLPGNIENAPFSSQSFDFICCLSVIEHGVNCERFFLECARLLRPGGFLLISTDYWDKPMRSWFSFDFLYKCKVKIFSRRQIELLVLTAKRVGFKLKGDLDLSCQDRVVLWWRMCLRFTFLFLVFQRDVDSQEGETRGQ